MTLEPKPCFNYMIIGIMLVVNIPQPLYHHLVLFEGSIIIVQPVSPENTNQITVREKTFVISNPYSPAIHSETLVVDFLAISKDYPNILLVGINSTQSTSKSFVRMEKILDSELKKPPKIYHEKTHQRWVFYLLK